MLNSPVSPELSRVYFLTLWQQVRLLVLPHWPHHSSPSTRQLTITQTVTATPTPNDSLGPNNMPDVVWPTGNLFRVLFFFLSSFN